MEQNDRSDSALCMHQPRKALTYEVYFTNYIKNGPKAMDYAFGPFPIYDKKLKNIQKMSKIMLYYFLEILKR